MPCPLQERFAPVWERSPNGPSQFGPTGTLKQILDVHKIYFEQKNRINFKLEYF
jgi:hypothetical protein